MSNRLGISGARLREAQAEKRSCLIGYLPVGYPSVADSLKAIDAISAGDKACDLVEIGMPYSDPAMDGPAIQYATRKALEAGVRTKDIFSAVEVVAGNGKIPLTMTYWNIVERYGPAAFARDFANAGGVGVIIPDLIPEEADEWMAATDEHQLDRIFLIAHSSSDERIVSTMQACRGWVYATAVMGVTGVRRELSDAAKELVDRARALDPELPIGVGVGVSNAHQAHAVSQFADAVIVGSVLVNALIDHEDDPKYGFKKLKDLAATLVNGLGHDEPI